jgi:hypothetical protein
MVALWSQCRAVVISVARQDGDWLDWSSPRSSPSSWRFQPDWAGRLQFRGYLGWVALAAGHGSGAVRQLVDARITDLEPYVLPLSGVLLLGGFGRSWRTTHVVTAGPGGPRWPQ